MKKIVLLISVIALTMSCNTEKKEEVAPVDTEALKQEILKKFQDSLANEAAKAEEKRITDSIANSALVKPVKVAATKKSATTKANAKTAVNPKKPTTGPPPTKQEEQAKKLEDKFGGASDKNYEQEVKKQEQKLKNKFGE